jgi:hypothetical protein
MRNLHLFPVATLSFALLAVALEGRAGPSSGSAPDTWLSFGRGFMARYCVRCHDDDRAGEVRRNYRLLAAVVRDRASIGCGIAGSAAVRNARGCPAGAPRARQLPVGDGPHPTDQERDRLLRWIDANTP